MEEALHSPVRALYLPPSPVRDAYPIEQILSFVDLLTFSYGTANEINRGDIDSDDESYDFTFRVPFNVPSRGATEDAKDSEDSEGDESEEEYDGNLISCYPPNLARIQDEYVILISIAPFLTYIPE